MSVWFLLGSVLFDEFFWGLDNILFAFLFLFELNLAFDLVHDNFLIFSPLSHDILEEIFFSTNKNWFYSGSKSKAAGWFKSVMFIIPRIFSQIYFVVL